MGKAGAVLLAPEVTVAPWPVAIGALVAALSEALGGTSFGAAAQFASKRAVVANNNNLVANEVMQILLERKDEM
jgi:hypothetical protein